jgi:arylsulfate sulfotransferase
MLKVAPNRSRVSLLAQLLVALASPLGSCAITFSTDPSFVSSSNAPLAVSLRVATDVASRINISVDDGWKPWQRNFYDFNTSHEVPLLGFKPGRTNQITVTVYDRNRQTAVADHPLVFVAPPLPKDFPKLTLLHSSPERMEPGYTLFRAALNGSRQAYHAIVEDNGEVVWYSPLASLLDVRQLANGDLFLFSVTNFMEVDMLGETVRSWAAPPNLPINVHDGVPTDHGTILYLSDATTTVSNYPTSTTDPNAPRQTALKVVYQKVVEISATNSALLNSWSLIDLLDPRRITYLTTLGSTKDSEHANALIEDPSDNSIIVSLRHQNAVIKFSRSTGRLIWILGPHENWGPEWQPYLLTPTGAPFEWVYGQHAPLLTPQGTLMVYDDGNYRATPFDPPVADADNYSRAVEYAIDSTNMTVSQVWDFGRDTSPRLYTDKVGSADPLPKSGNVLVTFGSVKYADGVPPSAAGPTATMARIQEVTHEAVPEVVFDLAVSEYDNSNVAFSDCFVYRSQRIPDLYAHPAQPVADLRVAYQDGTAHLEFSGDPARSYTIEVSSDLLTWLPLGHATEESGAGTFDFDTVADGSRRYYRVLTQ